MMVSLRWSVGRISVHETAILFGPFNEFNINCSRQNRLIYNTPALCCNAICSFFLFHLPLQYNVNYCEHSKDSARYFTQTHISVPRVPSTRTRWTRNGETQQNKKSPTSRWHVSRSKRRRNYIYTDFQLHLYPFRIVATVDLFFSQPPPHAKPNMENVKNKNASAHHFGCVNLDLPGRERAFLVDPRWHSWTELKQPLLPAMARTAGKRPSSH